MLSSFPTSHSLKAFWLKPGGLRELLKLAIPAGISQACFSLMMFTDRLLLTPFGKEPPAASMLGGFTSYLFIVFFCGLLSYITPLTGQLLGAKQKEKITGLVHGGIIISLLCYPFILFFGEFFASLYFEWTGVSQKQKELATLYFNIMNTGDLFVLMNIIFASFFSGIGKTSVIMKVNLFGMIVNFPLSYTLIKWAEAESSFTPIEGAALGSILSSLLMCVIFSMVFLQKEYKEDFGTNLYLKWNSQLVAKLIHFGSATGFEMTLVFATFSTFVALFHSYGANEALSATIVLNWEIVAFLPTFGVSIGLMSLVGKYMGAGELENAKRSIISATLLSLGTMLFACFIFITQTEYLIHIFLPDKNTVTYSTIMPLASTMLKLICFYCLANGVNLVLSGALRAAGDTKAVMYIALIGDWAMLFIAYYMIKIKGFDPTFTWGVFSANLFFQTILLGIRFSQGQWKKIRVV
jgi:MATE family multidrug resistance protein